MNLKSIIPWKKQEQAPINPESNGAPVDLFQKRMNDLFEDFFSGSPDLWQDLRRSLYPVVDVSETGKEIKITAELPGIDKNDLEVTISKDMVTIQGEKKEETTEEKGDLRHSECSYGYFHRSITLPPGVDPDKAQAKFKRNVLKISVPKTPEAQSRRRTIELAD